MLSIRCVQKSDCQLLWEWANDPEVRRWAFRPKPISWEEHANWFNHKMSDPGCSIYIFEHEQGLPVAQIRFEIQGDNKSAFVDISIAREKRGRGYGVQALKLGCQKFLEGHRDITIIALIKRQHQVSRSVFEKVGFVENGTEVIEGAEAIRAVLNSDKV